MQRWGEPRLTRDIDLTVLTTYGDEAPYVDAFLDGFRGRLPDAREFALQNRVVLLSSGSGVPIDVALGAMPFEERATDRATDFVLQKGVALTTCSAEDLVVFKAFAGREKDWLDIDGIALRQLGRLDESLIWTELTGSARPAPSWKDRRCPSTFCRRSAGSPSARHWRNPATVWHSALPWRPGFRPPRP